MTTRRRLLQSALFTSALAGVPLWARAQSGGGFADLAERAVVHVTLKGGPDMRYLLPPAFDDRAGSVGYGYWQAMATAHNIEDTPPSWEARANSDYIAASGGGHEFGILGSCGWLDRLWNAGNLAIICNVFGATTRDHPHALSVMHSGSHFGGRSAKQFSGWGGRLAGHGEGNVLAVNAIPLQLGFGEPLDGIGGQRDTSRLIAASDTRALSLFNAPQNATQERLVRSLRSYYAAKQLEMPSQSPYRRFVELEQQVRGIGELIDARLAGIAVPPLIDQLFATGRLYDPNFALQIRNVYDAFACSDIVAPRLISLEYEGFDTHDQQREELEPRLTDLFGEGMALHALYSSLPQQVLNNTVFVMSGEFGRQIRANGDGGTDHGEGNIVLVFGEGVRGGVYGEMFPDDEPARLDNASPQITGRTSFERVFAEVCEWVSPGAIDSVFPDLARTPLEPGLALDSLFV